ncbi:MAG: HEAT repeat domain-containing protein [Candidatus Dormibacteria bacterium]
MACQIFGEPEVARWCAELLDEAVGYDSPERPPLSWLGGEHARVELARGRLRERGQDYWPRVWAARGLCYAWSETAAGAVRRALADPSWRVRETAARVVRQRQLADAAERLAALTRDPVPRVRRAALLALGRVGEVEDVAPVRQGGRDPVPSVRAAAASALEQLTAGSTSPTEPWAWELPAVSPTMSGAP